MHYYFRTMDDLFLAVLRRRADRDIERFEAAIAADGSLRNLWRLNRDPRAGALTMELVALANHRKAIRDEIARYAERFRAAQLDAVTRALADAGVAESDVPPIAALLVMTGVSQVLTLEGLLGMTAGHDATRAFVDGMIDRLEGRDRA